MQRKKKGERFLHLLEVLLVIGLVSLAGGALFWRLDRFIQHKQFQSDTEKLKSALLHAKALALCTHSDIRLTLIPIKTGWKIQLQCLEDPILVSLKQGVSLRPSLLFVDDTPTRELKIDFFPSGHVFPKGILKFQAKDQNSLISLSELFGQS
jgi:hypothetical protein